MVRRSSRTTSFLIILTVSCAVLLLLHFLGPLKPVEGFLVRLTKPVVAATVRGSQRIFSVGSLLRTGKTLRADIARLSAENEKLKSDNARLSEVERENEALRKQLGFRERSNFTLVPAFVIGFDPNSFNEFMTIDQGSSEGIAEGNAVISDSGALVGRVQSVTGKSAQVLLINDPKSVLDAEVQSSRATGVVTGDHGLGLTMSKILQEATVVAGDQIITAGLGGTIPKGLLIGEVKDVHPAANELFQEARILPIVNFRDLEIVFVVTNF